MGRNDLELGSGPGALEDEVPDPGGYEAVDDAEDDRHIVHAVGEERCRCNSHVDTEHDPYQADLGMPMVHYRSHYIHSARASAKTHSYAVVQSAEDSCGDRRHDPLSGILPVESDDGQIHVLEYHVGHRENDDEYEGIDRIASMQEMMCKGQKRQVQDQVHHSEVDAEQVSDDRQDTVKSGRCEIVGKDKDLIVQGSEHGENADYHIIQYKSCFLIHLIPIRPMRAGTLTCSPLCEERDSPSASRLSGFRAGPASDACVLLPQGFEPHMIPSKHGAGSLTCSTALRGKGLEPSRRTA